MGSVQNIDEIAVWHYWSDARTYNSNVTSVSSDNSTWTTVINYSAPESSLGKRVNVWHSGEFRSVAYNANGGTGAPNPTIYQYAESGTVNLSSVVPTRTNYLFLGWSTSSSATEATYFPGDSWNISNASTTLYAVWQSNVTTYTGSVPASNISLIIYQTDQYQNTTPSVYQNYGALGSASGYSQAQFGGSYQNPLISGKYIRSAELAFTPTQNATSIRLRFYNYNTAQSTVYYRLLSSASTDYRYPQVILDNGDGTFLVTQKNGQTYGEVKQGSSGGAYITGNFVAGHTYYLYMATEGNVIIWWQKTDAAWMPSITYGYNTSAP